MQFKQIAVVDYGMGNLRSVAKALELSGARVTVTDRARTIENAPAVVFPGVGSFGPAIHFLKKRGLDRAIAAAVLGGKHFLGLCLGFQLLFDKSFEGGAHQGLGLISGDVRRFTRSRTRAAHLNVPHMGWNSVRKNPDHPMSRKMFRGIADNSYFYFVHSYYGIPDDRQVVCGTTVYGDPFCSALVDDRVWACQFHPEKSGANGLRLLKNFVYEVHRC